MSKKTLIRSLMDLRHTLPFSKAKVYQLSTTLVGNVAVRYQLLKTLDAWIIKNGGGAAFARLPTPEEWLMLAPIYIRRCDKTKGGMTSPETLVQLALNDAVKVIQPGLVSLTHITKLFKVSKICRLIDVPDIRDIEFIKAVPRDSERPMRSYSHKNFTVYFIDERFMILLNRTVKPRPDEDDNYFVSVYDLGGVLPYIIAGGLAFPTLTAGTTRCKVDKLPITRLNANVNKHLVLWDYVDSPAPHCWFVSSDLQLRNPLYSITYRRTVIPNHDTGVGIPEEMWENLVRVFAIPSTNQLRKLSNDRNET